MFAQSTRLLDTTLAISNPEPKTSFMRSAEKRRGGDRA
jgi:hypothetical protein